MQEEKLVVILAARERIPGCGAEAGTEIAILRQISGLPCPIQPK